MERCKKTGKQMLLFALTHTFFPFLSNPIEHTAFFPNGKYAIFCHKFNLESAPQPARPCPLPIVPAGGDEGKEGDHEEDNRRLIV